MRLELYGCSNSRGHENDLGCSPGAGVPPGRPIAASNAGRSFQVEQHVRYMYADSKRPVGQRKAPDPGAPDRCKLAYQLVQVERGAGHVCVPNLRTGGRPASFGWPHR